MKKFLLSIFALMLAVFSVQAQDYSYTFTSKQFTANGTMALGNVNWTLAGDGGYWGYDGTKGQQFGSSKLPYKTLTLSTSDIKGTITKIVINTSGASSVNASFTVSVGETQYGSSTKLTTSATDYTFTGSASGEIKLSYTQTSSKALYIKSIAVTYTTGTGEGSGTVEPDQPETPAAPTLPEATGFTTDEFVVEITNNDDNAIIWHSFDGEKWNEGSTVRINATTTVYAKAVDADDKTNESEVVYATYTKVELTEGCYVKVTSAPADWSGKYLIVYEDGANAYVFSGVDAVNGYVAAEITDGVIVANSEIDAVAVEIATMENGYSIECVNGYIYGTSGQNKLNFDTTTAWLNTIELAEDGVEITSGGVFCFNADSNQKRFRYYGKTAQKPVQLYKYIEPYTLSVTDAGYATLFLDFNAAIPTNVKAYTVTKVNDGYVTLTQVTGVLPANTGIIVNAEEGNYTFAYSKETPTTIEDNLLEGTVVATEIEENAYVLGIVEGEVGLYLAEMAGGVWLNNANKAYLPIASGAAMSAGFRFEFAGTTAIEEVETEVAETVIYDLTGRRVNKITKAGVYVVNGKKILVK